MLFLRVAILPTLFYFSLAKEKSKDTGFLSQCRTEILDLTITARITDSLRLLLVNGMLGSYHAYNISRAGRLIKDPVFRSDFRTVVFVHGFNDGGVSSTVIVPAYVNRGRHNIVLLNATPIIRLEYFRSTRTVRYIGRRLGVVLGQMYKSGLSLQTLELVGDSLGAHIVSFAAKTFRKVTSKSLPRIVGLDPAAPCFGNKDATQRIDRSDADFVQIIHTNSGGLGLIDALGHADFYINGGRYQPAESLVPCLNTCSHRRALNYWAAAVEYPRGFIGVRCDSLKEVEEDRCAGQNRKVAVMGTFADPRNKGIYYVKTMKTYPFAMGGEGILKKLVMTVRNNNLFNQHNDYYSYYNPNSYYNNYYYNPYC